MTLKVRTESGRPIAEWVMNNHASLNVLYIIWGQKIWNPSRDALKGWNEWRAMEDRYSITANHWYVSPVVSPFAFWCVRLPIANKR